MSMRSVITFVLGGGRGTRLLPLTKYRSKPAVPLAGGYRLIDIPISNCINSDLRRIYVLTQFMSVSLHRHIRQTYRFDSFSGGFVEILAAQQTMDAGTDWYQGTADAVRKNVRYLDQPGVDYVLILSGDQLYRMDFAKMLATHKESKADVTIASIPVDRESAKGLGIMRLDDSGRVIGFVEKPQLPEEMDSVATAPAWIDTQGVESRGRDCLASMGIYLFNKSTLLDVLRKTTYEDFGREIFPASIRNRHVQVHLFDGFWEDIGTIRAFYETNLALAHHNPPFDLALPEAPIFSHGRFLPPSQIQGATLRDSIIAEGCRIGKDVVIENSVIGLRCHIGEGVTIRNSVIMGSDVYETASDLEALGSEPPVGIGSHSLIEGAIVDKNCRIGRDVRIVVPDDRLDDRDLDSDCYLRDGIPVIAKGAIVPDRWQFD